MPKSLITMESRMYKKNVSTCGKIKCSQKPVYSCTRWEILAASVRWLFSLCCSGWERERKGEKERERERKRREREKKREKEREREETSTTFFIPYRDILWISVLSHCSSPRIQVLPPNSPPKVACSAWLSMLSKTCSASCQALRCPKRCTAAVNSRARHIFAPHSTGAALETRGLEVPWPPFQAKYEMMNSSTYPIHCQSARYPAKNDKFFAGELVDIPSQIPKD